MKYQSRIIILFLVPMLTFLSCRRDLVEDESRLDEHTERISEIMALGFKREAIVDCGEDYYLVDECYLVPKKGDMYNRDKTSSAEGSKSIGSGKKGQLHTDERVYHNHIKMYIDNSMPTTGVDNWRNAIAASIGHINGVQNINLLIELTNNPADADITVSSDNGVLANNVLASASFPLPNGKPGNIINVNLDYNGNQTLNEGQKIHTFVHEIGHTLGLHHTNGSMYWPGHNLVPNTPQVDGNSVMNGGTAGHAWIGFSGYDIVALNYLFPGVTISGPGYICSSGTFNIPNAVRVELAGQTQTATIAKTGTNTYVLSRTGQNRGPVTINAFDWAGRVKSMTTNVAYASDPKYMLIPATLGQNYMNSGGGYHVSIDNSIPVTSCNWVVTGGNVVSGQGTNYMALQVNPNYGPGDQTITITANFSTPCDVSPNVISKTFIVRPAGTGGPGTPEDPI